MASIGEKVVFFNGRRPMIGRVLSRQDDGNLVILVETQGGSTRLLKEEDEVKPFSEVKGKKANIRFQD
jgi:hypothetical protein